MPASVKVEKSYRVFDSHEAVAHPPSGSAVPADVGEGLVIVSIWGAEWNLLYGLVHDEVLTNRQTKDLSPLGWHSVFNLSES